MNKLMKHTIGTLQDAYDALVDGCIVCNPKYSPWQDPKYKYAKLQLLNDNSITAYGIGKVMMLEHFMSSDWKDGWELYYPEMYNERVITIDGKQYRLSDDFINKIIQSIFE